MDVFNCFLKMRIAPTQKMPSKSLEWPCYKPKRIERKRVTKNVNYFDQFLGETQMRDGVFLFTQDFAQIR